MPNYKAYHWCYPWHCTKKSGTGRCMVFRMILNDLELVCALSSTSALIFYWYIDIVKPVTGLLRLLITIGFPNSSSQLTAPQSNPFIDSSFMWKLISKNVQGSRPEKLQTLKKTFALSGSWIVKGFFNHKKPFFCDLNSTKPMTGLPRPLMTAGFSNPSSKLTASQSHQFSYQFFTWRLLLNKQEPEKEH